MRQIRTSVTIIGGGLAGLYTALHIDSSKRIDVIVKDDLKSTNSSLAQGGIAGELHINPSNIQAHIDDTLEAGSHLNNMEAVQILVNEAKENIDSLIAFNVKFDKDADGNILLTKEGGHSTRRILHSGGDSTGKGIMEALLEACFSRDNIHIHANMMALELIHSNNMCFGVSCLDKDNDTVHFLADYTVLATGGVGNLYGSTTNSKIATADGIGMAIRADVAVHDMEFVQFHPTAFYNEEYPERRKFLITEALRGEGATLVNSEKQRFMEKYSPLKELAPRDVVSQAIYREMYDTWTDHVYLDTRHMDKSFLEDRFPTIYSHLIRHNIEMGDDLIPVGPVQHFMVGGISIDLEGHTTMKQLFANGECATSGVHGANRLASNSLLECVVFGKRIATAINQSNPVKATYESEIKQYNRYMYNYKPMKKKLGMIMDEYAGIVRSSEGLTIANQQILRLYDNLMSYPNNSKHYYEALNMVQTALKIIHAALKRETSIGCHYRLDT